MRLVREHEIESRIARIEQATWILADGHEFRHRPEAPRTTAVEE